MNKKQWIRKTLALITLFLLLINVALAIEGDANLFTEENTTEYISSVAAVKDSIYFLGNKGLYQWNKTMTEPLLVSEDVQTWVMMSEEADESDPIKAFDGSIHALVGSGEGLFAINTSKGIWCSMEQETGKWIITPLKALDWEDMLISDGDWSYARQIYQTVIQDNTLALLVENESSYLKRDLICFDTEKGTQRKLEVENVQELAPYQNGKMLALQFDAERYEPDYKEMAKVIVIDLNTGDTAPFMELPYTMMAGLVYDQEKDCIYVSGDGSVFSGKPGEELSALNYIPVYRADNNEQGMLLDGGLYAVSNYGKTYVRNLDSSLKPGTVLTIEGTTEWDEAVKVFQKVQPGIPVQFEGSSWTVDNILQKMLMGDDTADLYMIYVSYSDFETLKSKGYTMDLSGSDVLMKSVEAMYPQVKEVIMEEGKLLAFPSRLTLYTKACVDNVFEEIGLEKPQTWADYIRVYGAWGDHLAADYPDLSLFDYGYFEKEGDASKQVLFEMINAYIEDMLLRDEALRFDTKVFRDLMDVFEEQRPSIDLIIQEQENNTVMYMEEPKNLFFDYEAITPERYRSSDRGTKVVFDFEEEKPAMIAAQFEVYLINPNSKNKDLAMLFLETYAQNMTESTKIALFPDENEPVISPHSVENIADMQKQIEEQEEALKTAEEAEKKIIEENIKYSEEYIEEYKNSEWYWDIPLESIEEYRSYDNRWGIVTYNPLYESQSSGISGDEGMWKIVDDYLNRAIYADEMIKRLDQRIQMVEMERE